MLYSYSAGFWCSIIIWLNIFISIRALLSARPLNCVNALNVNKFYREGWVVGCGYYHWSIVSWIMLTVMRRPNQDPVQTRSNCLHLTKWYKDNQGTTGVLTVCSLIQHSLPSQMWTYFQVSHNAFIRGHRNYQNEKSPNTRAHIIF